MPNEKLLPGLLVFGVALVAVGAFINVKDRNEWRKVEALRRLSDEKAAGRSFE